MQCRNKWMHWLLMRGNSMSKSSFGFEKPRQSPGFILWQVTITWQRRIKLLLDDYGLSHAQFVILALLLWREEQKEQTVQVHLVNMSKLDKMTVSQALKKLVHLGFVLRREHQQDTRAKRVVLTLQGKRLVKKLVPLVEKIDEEFFSVLSLKQQKSLHGLLQDLLAE